MPTLVVAHPPFPVLLGAAHPLPLRYALALGEAAHAAGWSVVAGDGVTLPPEVADPAVYVTTDRALGLARRLGVALLEPPLGLLAELPPALLLRRVEVAAFGDLGRLRGPTFVKPADPLDKWFDPGVYRDARDIRTRGRSSPDAPVLLSEPVTWETEYRYFVLDGRPVAGSVYLSYGRPCWRRFDPRADPRSPGRPLVERLCRAMAGRLPPAFVVDVGVIDGRGWGVVEFNPAWCSGLLAADPAAVLPVLRRASRPRAELGEADRRWVVGRPGGRGEGGVAS